MSVRSAILEKSYTWFTNWWDDLYLRYFTHKPIRLKKPLYPMYIDIGNQRIIIHENHTIEGDRMALVDYLSTVGMDTIDQREKLIFALVLSAWNEQEARKAEGEQFTVPAYPQPTIDQAETVADSSRVIVDTPLHPPFPPRRPDLSNLRSRLDEIPTVKPSSAPPVWDRNMALEAEVTIRPATPKKEPEEKKDPKPKYTFKNV
jgi:hypothetical protein